MLTHTHMQFKLYYTIRSTTAASSFSCLISPAHTLLSYGVTSTDFDPLAVYENQSYTVNHLLNCTRSDVFTEMYILVFLLL